jgi:hypothetical protein
MCKLWLLKVNQFFHLHLSIKVLMRHILLSAFIAFSLQSYAQPSRKTENVILITLDGMRWQDVFGGADSSLMKQQDKLKDPKVREKFWRTDLLERRKALFPFLWTTVADKGQIFGNRILGNKVNVTNTMWFSYPGYNEILTGFADDARISSNDKVYNENETVLEYINYQPAFSGKVAAFTSWDVFSYIINDKRSGVFVSAGEMKAERGPLTERELLLNQMMVVTPNMLEGVRLDAFTFYFGLEYMRKNKPRVMYFSFDETDDFAHEGEYAAYLNSARNTDGFLSELYNYLQSDPTYKGKTTMIITTDHGRGGGPVDWRSHGSKVTGADQIWMAIIGPDTPALGEAKTEGQRYQNQIAQTMAALLGLKYESKNATGKVLDGVLISK